VVGGAVPRNYIGAVEEGVVDALVRGPLGFPVIDVHVTLTDGSYHSVDSSDLAFRTAARIGVSEALPQCQPVLLEPIHVVEIVCPTEATAKINAILSARRGQILSFDTREGWSGWDCVRATMPEAEIGDLIVELRSATAGRAASPGSSTAWPKSPAATPTRSSPRIATRRDAPAGVNLPATEVHAGVRGADGRHFLERSSSRPSRLLRAAALDVFYIIVYI
jgi:translation elongation factor EF-G